MAVLACLLVAMSAALPPAAWPTEPDTEEFGRACLMIEEDASPEGAYRDPTVFDETAAPGPGKRLVLNIEASLDVHVLI